MIDGLAIVDKPAGMTSHDVVSRCRKVFGQKRVGHGGTLDPDATGVLLIGLGRATRLLGFLSGLSKSYEAEVVLGIATSTLDAAGEITGRWDQRTVTLDDARRAAGQLTGAISQVPPMVSAVKVGGRRLHELARRGIEVERAPRQVVVTRFAVSRSEPGEAGPVLGVEIDCSSGTYVRVLGADLGALLDGGAHVRNLRRTAVGPWTVDMATALDSLSIDDVRPPVEALPWLVEVVADERRAVEITNGRVLDRADLGVSGDGPWRVVGSDGGLLAVYEQHGGDRIKPAMVMAPDNSSSSTLDEPGP